MQFSEANCLTNTTVILTSQLPHQYKTNSARPVASIQNQFCEASCLTNTTAILPEQLPHQYKCTSGSQLPHQYTSNFCEASYLTNSNALLRGQLPHQHTTLRGQLPTNTTATQRVPVASPILLYRCTFLLHPISMNLQQIGGCCFF